MTDAPQTPTQVNPPAANPQLSHLSSLHRMSRTAGLGSSDYTAVNTAAVVAVLIGAASALALMTPIFLLLPVIGLVIAFIAIAQVRRSNGTQTGMALAILGLLLCLGFAASTGYKAYKLKIEHDRDIDTLKDTIHQFGQYLGDQKYTEAYALTDGRFKDQVTFAKFQTFFSEMQAAPPIGKITNFHSNGIFGIDVDPETDARAAVGIGLLETQRRSGDQALRTEIRYRNANGQWVIYAIPEWFAPAKPAAGAGGPVQPGPGGAPQGPAGPPMP